MELNRKPSFGELSQRISSLFYLRRNGPQYDENNYFNHHYNMELVYLKRGSLKVWLGDVNWNITAGEVVVIPSMANHKISVLPGEVAEYWTLGFDEQLLIECDLHFNDQELVPSFNDPQVNELFEKIILEESERAEGHVFFVQGLILQMVILLIRNHIIQITNVVSKSSPVKKAVAYIHKNYSQAISLKELSQHVGVTESYISRLFKKEMGVTVVDYANKYRCLRAKALLSMTDNSITRIAEECGFSSPDYFAKIYRKYYGYSPSSEPKVNE